MLPASWEPLYALRQQLALHANRQRKSGHQGPQVETRSPEALSVPCKQSLQERPRKLPGLEFLLECRGVGILGATPEGRVLKSSGHSFP